MRVLVRTAFSIGLLSCVVSCGPRGQAPDQAKRVSPPPPPTQIQQLPSSDLGPVLANIPPNASREQMDGGVNDFMTTFSKSRSGDLQKFTNALTALREQPQLVSAIAAHYDRLPKPDHTGRISTLAVLGELKRPDAMPFLQKTVWTPMPARQPLEEGLTERDLEEMVIVKALQGVGYLRSPDSDKALLDVMQFHESRAVRIAAIDSYMWNHDDTSASAQFLYQTLPADLHKFVDRPRFHRGMDRNRFNEQLAAWQRKWAAPSQ